MRKLIADLTPCFRDRPVVYVDCSPRDGAALRAFADSGLTLGAAHFIAPDPAAAAALNATAEALRGRIGGIRLHPGQIPGRQAAGTAPDPQDAGCAGARAPLDALARDLGDGHISILRLAADGPEPEALEGAAGLLSRQGIDVVYVETGVGTGAETGGGAGRLGDRLAAYGYRPFGVYGPDPEGPGDGPVGLGAGRGAGRGFVSERLAAACPQLLTHELRRLEAEADGLRERAEMAAAEIEGLRVEVARARLAAGAAAGRRDGRELAREHKQLLEYGRWLEKRYAEILASHSWRALGPARWLSRRIRRRNPPADFTPRLGTGGLARFREPQRARAAVRLDDKLWGGFSATALGDLEALAADPGRPGVERVEAWFALARWRHANGDCPAALAAAQAIRQVDPDRARVMRVFLLEADCLNRLGRAQEATALLEAALSQRPNNGDLHLALANCLLGPDAAAAPGVDARRLARINNIYHAADLAPLILRDPARPLAIDNLATGPVPPEGDGPGAAKISVLMPVYAAADTLPFALRSLLAQSWRNLEVIVADDCSPDGTVAVAEAFAATDPRVRVVRQPENRGSYAARNAALRAASGDFVTTHDADDWSHPRKLAIQARFMAENPQVQASFSDWARVAHDMRAGWLYRAWGGYTSKSMSSIFLRRAAMDALGGWDPVRVGGDTDLLRRAEALFGEAAIQRVRHGVPLAFALHAERSLTRASATHVRTMLHGARREYDEAGAFWRAELHNHDGRDGARAALRFAPGRPRPFPAPALILGEPAQRYDIVFVSDFALKGGAFVSTLNAIEAAAQAGLSVGAVHWRRYDLDVTQEMNPALRRLAQKGAIRMIAPGEAATTRTTVVGYPVVLRTPMDLLPRIGTDNLVVVVNQMAERLYSGGDPQYDPLDVRARLVEAFGTEGIWAPISGLVQRLMRADARYPAPAATIWTPLADTATWCATPVRWRGGDGRPPTIGRHARDHYTKWPASREALRAAYCADRPCRVEIMGGAAGALAVMGAQPGNWTVHPFGSMGARSFLGRLDAFVHYPHEDYIEEFGRAVLEAIALGLPAILPPVFRESFGEAALYAAPDAVWSTLAALWADEAAWLAQGRAGQDFVRRNSDWTLFPARLEATLAEARNG